MTRLLTGQHAIGAELLSIPMVNELQTWPLVVVNKTLVGGPGANGIAPRLAFGTNARIGQGINGGPGSNGIAPRLAFGSNGHLVNWPAGVHLGKTKPTTPTDASTTITASQDGRVFTAGVLTVTGSNIRLTNCDIKGRVILQDAPNFYAEDCWIDFASGGAGNSPLSILGTTSGEMRYCTISGFKDVGPVMNCAGPFKLSRIKARPSAPAAPGPPGPQTLVGGANGIAPRLAFGGSGHLVRGGNILVGGAHGIAPRLAFGGNAIITAASASTRDSIALVPPYLPTDTAIDRSDKCPNWYREFSDKENIDHGVRPSLFPTAKVDAGYMDITFDAATQMFVSAKPAHGPTPGPIPSACCGKFDAAHGWTTPVMWKDPILSDHFGKDIIYDVTGWSYLWNMKFTGRFNPGGGGTAKCLVVNLEIDNLKYTQAAPDLDTFWMSPDADSAWFAPAGMTIIARNILLMYSGNGNAAFQFSNCKGSIAAYTTYRYQQDAWKVGSGSGDFWHAFGLMVIHPAVRDSIEHAEPKGAVWTNKTGVNTAFFFKEKVDRQQNTALEYVGSATAQPLSVETYTAIGETWNDPSTFTGDVFHIRVHLATNSSGKILSTANEVKAAMLAIPAISDRITIQNAGADDGTGVVGIWPDKAKPAGQPPGDRFQIPNTQNHLLPHSDSEQLFTWDQTGFCPPLTWDGKEVPGYSGWKFVSDPNYPGRRGTCGYKICCIEGNHGGIYLQGAGKSGAGVWPNDAQHHVVYDLCRIHAYNNFWSDSDGIACGIMRSHCSDNVRPANTVKTFRNTEDVKGPYDFNTNRLTGAPTTDPLLNTHHINPPAGSGLENVYAHNGAVIGVTR